MWRCVNARGAEHDSSAFKESRLYKKLEDIYDDPLGMMHNNIYDTDFYIIGDSAYAL